MFDANRQRHVCACGAPWFCVSLDARATIFRCVRCWVERWRQRHQETDLTCACESLE